jgi:hypothetical protein
MYVFFNEQLKQKFCLYLFMNDNNEADIYAKCISCMNVVSYINLYYTEMVLLQDNESDFLHSGLMSIL